MGITSNEWHGPDNRLDRKPTDEEIDAERKRRQDLLASRYKLATDYANEIMNPSALNWISVDWIWL